MKLLKKTAWFMVLMVWVGMVAAVMLYQNPEEGFFNTEFALEGLEESNFKKVDQPIEDFIETSEIEIEEVSTDEERSSLDFFVEYRIDRDKARSEQINLLREMINNPNSDESIKTQAQERLLKITDNIEQEMEVESLIRAKGYQDGVVVIRNESADIIIADEGLTQKDVAQIADIVIKNTNLNAQDVSIIEKAP